MNWFWSRIWEKTEICSLCHDTGELEDEIQVCPGPLEVIHVFCGCEKGRELQFKHEIEMVERYAP